MSGSMVFIFTHLLTLFLCFYFCNCYSVNFCSDRLIYRNNFNDTFNINCTLVDKKNDISSSNITIVFYGPNNDGKFTKMDNYIYVLDDDTIQLKIENVQVSHSGNYRCVNKLNFETIKLTYSACFLPDVQIEVGDQPIVPDLQTRWIDDRSISGTFVPSLDQVQMNTKINQSTACVKFKFLFKSSPDVEWINCDEIESQTSLCVMNKTDFHLTKKFSASDSTFSFYASVEFPDIDLVNIFSVNKRIWEYHYTDIFQPSSVLASEVVTTTFPHEISLQLPSASERWMTFFLFQYKVTWYTSTMITLGSEESMKKTQFNLSSLRPYTCYNIGISRRFVLPANLSAFGHWSTVLSMTVCTQMTFPDGSVSWPPFWWRLAADHIEMWWHPFASTDWNGDNGYYRVELFDWSNTTLARRSVVNTYLNFNLSSTNLPVWITLQACNSVGCSETRTKQFVPSRDLLWSEDLVRFDVEKVQKKSGGYYFAIIVFVNSTSLSTKLQLNISGFILVQNESDYFVVANQIEVINSTGNIRSIQLNLTYDSQLNLLFSVEMTSTLLGKSTGLLQRSTCVYGSGVGRDNPKALASQKEVDCANYWDSCDVSFQFPRVKCEDYNDARVKYYEVQYGEASLQNFEVATAHVSSDSCRFSSQCELRVHVKKGVKYRYKIVAFLNNEKTFLYADWLILDPIRDDANKFALIAGCVLAGFFLFVLIAVLYFKVPLWFKKIKQGSFTPYTPQPHSNWLTEIGVDELNRLDSEDSANSSGLGSSLCTDYNASKFTIVTTTTTNSTTAASCTDVPSGQHFTLLHDSQSTEKDATPSQSNPPDYFVSLQ